MPLSARSISALAALCGALAAAPGRAAEAPPGAALPAPDTARTLLAIPFAPVGDTPDWVGVAIAESLTDAVAQANVDAFLTLKQLDSVLRRRDLRLNDPRVADQALSLARSLGATEVVTGTADVSGDRVVLTARRLRVADGAELQKAEAKGARAALPALAHKLSAELLGAPKAGPLTRSAKAYELVARCAIDLDRQSLGPRSKTTLAGEKLEAAEAMCKAALEADPKLGLAEGYVAVLLSLKNRNVEARKLAARAQTHGRYVPLAALADWYAARRAGDLEGARKALEGAVAQRPGFLHALGYLAEERQEAGEEQAAYDWYARYLDRSPGHPWATARAARALARLGKKDEAIALTQKALTRSPDDPELLIELASRHLDAGHEPVAEAILVRVQTFKPVRPLASLRLGYLYLNQGKLKPARDQLLKAISQATREDEARTRAVAYADLAQVAGKEDLYENAVEALKAASREGMGKLPCAAPELAKWKGKPEFEQACTAPKAPPGGFTDDEVVDMEL